MVAERRLVAESDPCGCAQEDLVTENQRERETEEEKRKTSERNEEGKRNKENKRKGRREETKKAGRKEGRGIQTPWYWNSLSFSSPKIPRKTFLEK